MDLNPETSELLRYNPAIFDSFEKSIYILQQHKNAMCSVSGGSDSDVVVDIMTKIDGDHRIKYVWFDTGLEYQATKDHLYYLENRYGIKIDRIRPDINVPIAVRKFGQPFMSKYISSQIEKLQAGCFCWEDEPYDVLADRYPQCGSAIKWWCNWYGVERGFTKSIYNINYRAHLKEFMIAHPPQFPVSSRCCNFAKKDAAHKYEKENCIDLSITGVRKNEGGIRSAAYDDCFIYGNGGLDVFMPIFWYTNDDKNAYCELFDIKHSDCYTKWGFTRTGCSCCPFGKDLQKELITLEIFEPKISVAAKNVFHDTYEYTHQYLQFCKEQYQYLPSGVRAVRCVETGVVYDSISDASKDTGISTQSISNCINGDSKTAGKCHWEYADKRGNDYHKWNKNTKRKKRANVDGGGTNA